MLDRESYLCGTIRERFERLERQTSHPYITKHFQLDQLITSVYRERDVPGKIDECIEYCKEDIALYPDFIKIWLETNRNPPRIRPFARLAIIYEKQEKYSEASEVVRIASGYGLEDDGTKGGITHCLKRLERRLLKQGL